MNILLKMMQLMVFLLKLSIFLLNDTLHSLFFLLKDYIFIDSLLQAKTSVFPLLEILQSILQNPIDSIIFSQQIINFVLHLRKSFFFIFPVLGLQTFIFFTQVFVLTYLIPNNLIQPFNLVARAV